jgi:hypothetical protein
LGNPFLSRSGEDFFRRGVWGYTIRRSHIVVKVNLFCSSTTAIRKEIAAEAQRLSHLFEKEVVLEDESPSSSQL